MTEKDAQFTATLMESLITATAAALYSEVDPDRIGFAVMIFPLDEHGAPGLQANLGGSVPPPKLAQLFRGMADELERRERPN